MKRLIVANGEDELTAPIVDYLERQYGIPKDHIRKVQLDSEVGRPQFITVTLFVDQEENPNADRVARPPEEASQPDGLG